MTAAAIQDMNDLLICPNCRSKCTPNDLWLDKKEALDRLTDYDSRHEKVKKILLLFLHTYMRIKGFCTSSKYLN